MSLFFRLIIRQITFISIVIGIICFFVLALGGILPPAPRIVYMAEAKDTATWELFMLDLWTGASIRLTNTSFINERYPAWSSDGQRIAYHADTPTSDLYDIQIIPSNNPTEITVPFTNDGNIGVFAFAYDKAMPAWSPDDVYLGFHAKIGDGRYGLFIGRADGRETWMVIDPLSQSDVLHFAWSPDGSQISYTITTGVGTSHVYRLTLPDSIQLAQTNRANQEQIVTEASFPAWSPDGTKLVYVHETDNGSRLFLYDFATQISAPLTELGNGQIYDDTHPEWSPDGKYIVFASNRRVLSYDLYIIQADGNGLNRLITAGTNALAPDWTD